MLATEDERRESGYKKAESDVLALGGDLVSVNLGIMWARRGSPLLQEAERKAKASKKGSVIEEDERLAL